MALTNSITNQPSATVPVPADSRLVLDQPIGTAVAATALVAGLAYRIETLGSTTWTACGFPADVSPAVGLTFEATAAGTGTGTAIQVATREAPVSALLSLVPGTNLTYDPVTGLLSSSTGDDVILTLADAVNPGLLSAAGFSKLESITVDVAKIIDIDVRNNSGVEIPKGQPVYFVGSSGTRPTVALAYASSDATSARTRGLAIAAIPHNSDGKIRALGQLDGLNTSTLLEGAILWLGTTAGAITTTRPTQPAHGVALGQCIKQGSGTSGIVYVDVSNGQELDELHDVLITTAQERHALFRNSSGLWVNRYVVAADISDSTATGRGILTGAAQGANVVLAGPVTGAAAAPTWRQLTAGDISGLAAVATSGSKVDIGLANVDNTSDASKPISSAMATALAGKADLSGPGGTVPSAQLPSFVDDVLEFANVAAFPATGETGKLYVSLATNRFYRWSGSIYVEIVGSPGSTDAVPEGSVNLYFTTARGESAAASWWSANQGAPGAIGGTTPSAGTFSILGATSRFLLPTSRPALADRAAGQAYLEGGVFYYRDGSNTEQRPLTDQGNLADVASPATARANLGAAPASASAGADLFLLSQFT